MIFPCLIVTSRIVFQTSASANSAPGWFKHGLALRVLFSLRKNTEAAPNSYTGSGRGMFPCSDGFLSSPSKGYLRISVPETSPCHTQAKQIGALDPRRAAPQSSGAFAAESRPRRTRHRQCKRIGAVRRRLCAWAASAGPLTFENPRSPARRPIQADEVEPMPHRSHRGIVSQMLTPRVRSLVLPQFGVQLATPGRGWFNCYP